MMKFLAARTLKAKFPKAVSLCQLRVITRMGSTLDVEGPVSEVQAQMLIRMALGDDDGRISDDRLKLLMESSDIKHAAKMKKNRGVKR